uniref:Uncharacterized protein n=1 Tax=Anguilla anguilla TaxID=7936 RepID=A0A0E9VJX8_ANGAN
MTICAATRPVSLRHVLVSFHSPT